MGLLKCPDCGKDLEIEVSTCSTNRRKINKDGSLHKVINRGTGQPYGSTFLVCSDTKCGFAYDTEHASHHEPIKLFDDWISEHLEEITAWK